MILDGTLPFSLMILVWCDDYDIIDQSNFLVMGVVRGRGIILIMRVEGWSKGGGGGGGGGREGESVWMKMMAKSLLNELYKNDKLQGIS